MSEVIHGRSRRAGKRAEQLESVARLVRKGGQVRCYFMDHEGLEQFAALLLEREPGLVRRSNDLAYAAGPGRCQLLVVKNGKHV